MKHLLHMVLLAGLLAGCAATPPATEADCCHGPPPGTASVHLDADMVADWTVGRH